MPLALLNLLDSVADCKGAASKAHQEKYPAAVSTSTQMTEKARRKEQKKETATPVTVSSSDNKSSLAAPREVSLDAYSRNGVEYF